MHPKSPGDSRTTSCERQLGKDLPIEGTKIRCPLSPAIHPYSRLKLSLFELKGGETSTDT